jgi:hypothetical protein
MLLTGCVFADNALHSNLAGLSNLCNKGCKVTLTDETITVSIDDENIWYGTKGTQDKLWNLHLIDLDSTMNPAPTAALDSAEA